MTRPFAKQVIPINPMARKSARRPVVFATAKTTTSLALALLGVCQTWRTRPSAKTPITRASANGPAIFATANQKKITKKICTCKIVLPLCYSNIYK
mmetsp:Transcript_3117/g.3313  ORF Transcript_3117/g.3313 Transcript_3117/m.3313 type:complete len:96 (-) Transcript_3117:121-408(-)